MAFFRKAPEKRFWEWFAQNEERLFHFESDQDAVFAELRQSLKRVDESLTFEFGSIENGKREFTISADGIQSAFPTVERLFESAPTLDRWEIVKYRQPMPEVCDLSYNGVEVAVADVQAAIARSEENEQLLDVLMFLPDDVASDSGLAAGVGFLLLDQALGEYAVATQIGAVYFLGQSEHPDIARFPFGEFRARFEHAFDVNAV